MDKIFCSDDAIHKILLVDDAAAIREAYGGLLRKKGYAVETVETGEDALKELNSNQYDLVLLDLKLKGMDGIETLTRIRQRKNDIKVLVISAYLNDDFKDKTYRLGVHDCLEKPFSIDALTTSIRQALTCA